MPEPSRRPRWTALAVTGWLAAVVVATALTIGAVSLIQAGLFGGSSSPLSEAEVASALAAASSEPSPTPTTSAVPSPSPTTPAPTPATSATRPPTTAPPTTPPPPDPPPTTPPPATSAAVAFSRAGNTVVARCAAGVAQVVSWSPAQGYRVSDGVNQHGSEAEVEFESEDHEVRIRVSCVGDQPTAEIEED